MSMDRYAEVLTGQEDNYILPFFWQHGEDEATLREYMNVIHECNIGAVCVESRPHPEFAGARWWQDMDVILDEAQKLGMKVWILDDSHFPTGYANGAVLQAPKELRHRYLGNTTAEIAGPRPAVELRIEDMIHPPVIPPWVPMPTGQSKAVIGDDRFYKVYACEVLKNGKLGKPMVLDHQIDDGVLVWDVPEGYWRIFVVYLTYDGRGRDDYINFLDYNSCRLLIDAVYEPHYEHYKEYFGSVIAGFFSDEPPIGNTAGYKPAAQVGTDPQAMLPWSDAMEERLIKSFGNEEWSWYLPYLWGTAEDADAQARICTAYMEAVSRLVQECFSLQLGEWCEEHGVEYIGHQLEDVDFNSHMGPSMGHFFRGLDGQHMAGIDNIGNSLEIGTQNTGRRNPYSTKEANFYHYVLGKLGASHAAIDPKKKGRALCENFGAYGWQTGVRTMKYLLDALLVRGINYYVPHAFTPKAFPDPDCPPHFYAHGENPQLEAFGSLMKYANRVCHLISGGISKPSAAILYHAESDWAGPADSNADAARELSQHQIDYQILPADVFIETEKYKTEWDGETLTVNGTSYHTLVVSGCDYISLSAAAFIKDAIAAGFPVVAVGRRPRGVSDIGMIGETMEDGWQQVLNAIPVVTVEQLAPWMCEKNLHEVQAEKSAPYLTMYHYDNGKDVYLFLNEDPAHAYTGTIRVAAQGVPVQYDAWSNEAMAVPYHKQQNGMEIHLQIHPLELQIVIFTEEKHSDLLKYPVNTAKEEIVLKNYKVSYAESKEYPNHMTLLDGAGSGEDLKGMGRILPDFSGWYRYETSAEIQSEFQQAHLVIEDVYESAHVYVNGQNAGDRTAQPYVYDVTQYLHKGYNEIRIDVATNMERKVRAMGIDVNCMNLLHPYSQTGIVGTVKLILA